MKKDKKLIKFMGLSTLFAGFGLNAMGVVAAEEVPVGYVVGKANLSTADNQTFEGHNPGAMITPVMRKMVELGLTLKLGHSKPVALSQSLLAATEKYSKNKNVKYDKATRIVSGYVAGVPFPNLSATDPDLVEKIQWGDFMASRYLPMS